MSKKVNNLSDLYDSFPDGISNHATFDTADLTNMSTASSTVDLGNLFSIGGGTDYYDLVDSVFAADGTINWPDGTFEFPETYNLVRPEKPITLSSSGHEMIRIEPDGFYVRGEKVPQDSNEARAVYDAFRQWMTAMIITGEFNSN